MNNCQGTVGTVRSCSDARAIAMGLVCVILAMTLAGCEAPLDLTGVNAQLSLPTHRADLFQASARLGDTVITVGGMGVVVQSQDGGNSWQRTTLPGKPFLVDVAACPDGHFHAIDKTDGLWSSQPDGSWKHQALPEMTEPQAITCDTHNVLWVTGSFSTIIHSVDTGTNWESWSLDEDLYLTTIQFPDPGHGVVTGEFGAVLLSSDGGLSWNRAADLPDSFYPQSAYFSDSATGWVVGLNGTIWKTVNGGQSWQQAATGIAIPLYGITGFGNTLVAVGENTTIVYYKMGDPAWTLLEGAMKSRTYLRSIIAVDDKQFITAGGGGALFAFTLPDNGTAVPENAP